MHKSKRYIEFVGQHTAGKTATIHEIVDNDLLAPNVAVYPQQLKRSRVHLTVLLPWLCIRQAHHLLFLLYFSARYAKLNWINYHAAGRHLWKMILLHPYYERHDFDIWMKDDMLHILPRIAFRHGVDAEVVLRQFFNHFVHLYDGIVYIDVSYDTMQERFAARFEDRSSKRKKSRVPVYERAFEQNKILKKILTEQTRIPLLILDGTADVRENALKVADFINTNVIKH